MRYSIREVSLSIATSYFDDSIYSSIQSEVTIDHTEGKYSIHAEVPRNT